MGGLCVFEGVLDGFLNDAEEDDLLTWWEGYGVSGMAGGVDGAAGVDAVDFVLQVFGELESFEPFAVE